nr:MAG TPA: hypothetical protein [Caudoviricetes sp.]
MGERNRINDITFFYMGHMVTQLMKHKTFMV